MPPQKESVEARSTILAIVLADSFNQRFRPITIQRPAVLLPVLNVPLIEYTLEWLACNHVDEVLVFCCAHADRITDYLKTSKWSPDGDAMKVTPVVAQHQNSIGDAMRFLDQAHLVKSDFILVSGDTVTNVELAPILAEHNKRRQKSKSNIATMVMIPGVSAAQRRRLGEVDAVSLVEPGTNRLLSYVEKGEKGEKGWNTKIDATFFGETDAIQVRTDLMSSQIYICGPEVLMLFSDNFDYQNIRRHFLNGVLSEVELGNKIHMYESKGEYGVRVQSLRSYDAVSRDLMQRWVYPFAPDTGVLNGAGEERRYKYGRGSRYIAMSVTKEAFSEIGRNVCIGRSTTIGHDCKIWESVIGFNCRIDDGAEIIGSYIEDDVHVGKGARVYHSLVCKGCVIHPDAHIRPGSLLSFDVVISPFHSVPEYSRVTMCPQPDRQDYDSDDELEYSPMADESAMHVPDLDDFEGPSSFTMKAANILKAMTTPRTPNNEETDRPQYFDDSLVGPYGAGRGWVQPDNLDDKMLSIAPPPEPLDYDGSDDDSGDSEIYAQDDEQEEEEAEGSFEQEVAETFLRCMKMKFDKDNAKLELNGLRMAEVKSFSDCAGYILTTLFLLCMPPLARISKEFKHLFPHQSRDLNTPAGRKDFLETFEALIEQWGPLMCQFLMNHDDQVDLLLTFEEFYKGEGAFDVPNHWGSLLGPMVPRICQILYENDIVPESAFIAWADEKENAEGNDLEVLDKALAFITWLKEAEEETDSEEEEEEEDDD
ncbi:hypothetical protein BSKO_02105 [Bryopsis sp. KO-2023]|nr:hypothetical protein BSKO_02105 [Bryopsis sp. KO-2023]